MASHGHKTEEHCLIKCSTILFCENLQNWWVCLIPFPTKICTYVKHIIKLYHPAAGYNNYVELIGGAIGVGACAAVRRGNKIYTIDDDIPLLHFLSGQCFL